MRSGTASARTPRFRLHRVQDFRGLGFSALGLKRFGLYGFEFDILRVWAKVSAVPGFGLIVSRLQASTQNPGSVASTAWGSGLLRISLRIGTRQTHVK